MGKPVSMARSIGQTEAAHRNKEPRVRQGPLLHVSSTALQRALADPGAARPNEILALQRRCGNRAVQRLLANHAVQAKLTVGPAGDHFEQEADRVASQVMAMPAQLPGSRHPVAQRKAEEKDLQPIQTKSLGPDIALVAQRQAEEEELQAQAEHTGGNLGATSYVEARLSAQKGEGLSLPGEVRGFMEPRFDADFSGVRVHSDAQSDQLARTIQSKAFMTGQDIFFRQGAYQPDSQDGQTLIAHELTHVLQQSPERPGPEGRVAERRGHAENSTTIQRRFGYAGAPPSGFELKKAHQKDVVGGTIAVGDWDKLFSRIGSDATSYTKEQIPALINRLIAELHIAVRPSVVMTPRRERVVPWSSTTRIETARWEEIQPLLRGYGVTEAEEVTVHATFDRVKRSPLWGIPDLIEKALPPRRFQEVVEHVKTTNASLAPELPASATASAGAAGPASAAAAATPTGAAGPASAAAAATPTGAAAPASMAITQLGRSDTTRSPLEIGAAGGFYGRSRGLVTVEHAKQIVRKLQTLSGEDQAAWIANWKVQTSSAETPNPWVPTGTGKGQKGGYEYEMKVPLRTVPKRPGQAMVVWTDTGSLDSAHVIGVRLYPAGIATSEGEVLMLTGIPMKYILKCNGVDISGGKWATWVDPTPAKK
jgi:hypothetical protein